MHYSAPILWRKSKETYQLPAEGSGKGKIVSFSVVRKAARLFKSYVPYIIAVVELDTGQRLISQIVDCKIEEIKIGMKVEATFRKIFVENEKSAIAYGIKFCPIYDIY